MARRTVKPDRAGTDGTATARLRPVLMTAAVTILSLIPVALGLGQGTEISSPMAVATLGGLLISTILTLVILPLLYLIVEERKPLGDWPSGFHNIIWSSEA